MTDAVSKIGEYSKFGSVLDLERINKLLSLLGNPHEKLKVIHTFLLPFSSRKNSAIPVVYAVK